VAFNTAVIAGVEEYTSWDDVLARPASDGDKVMFMGLKWRYDGTASIWVPAWVYGETILDKLLVDGDEANDAALVAKGWTVNKAAGGTVTYDGVRVRFKGDSADADISNVAFTHTGDQDDKYFFYGRVRADNWRGTPYWAGCIAGLDDGTHSRQFSFLYTSATDYAGFIGNMAKKGEADVSIDFTTERFVLIFWRKTTGEKASYAWVQGGAWLPAPNYAYTGTTFTGTASKRLGIGVLSSGAGSDVHVRDVVFARY